ncbi:hypothetical protein [Subtercola boreus]|uniref:Uncharacterized protein n=1 Tax=Subtercola boreus TaxID=120213 RepID=A0A3E0WDV3_9MICO|nr:hypothetical protein [Subtercola boreus]RFA23398.1 hypothetical protein B7R24_00410 [Subtercola boreus]RFA23791.1 hypothetical protein B7R23_00410 [Subtercola boreus]RFA29492.1 hypothetical protein B7R25_00405 [Subtercola boreus]
MPEPLHDPHAPLDPTRVTSQPALTTSTGRIWLIVGGLFAAISAAVLFFLLPFTPHGLAAVALIVIVLLYASMVITQLVTRRGRPRLGILAALMILMAVTALAAVLVLAASQTTPGAIS